MKRFTLLSIAAIMAVFASCLFTACSDDQSKDGVKVKPTETFVFYVDLEQLGTKSAIDEVITDGNRSLIATVLTADSYNSEWTEYAKTLLKNLSTSGLDTSVPVYGYLNTTHEDMEMAVFASVSSAAKVDKFMEFFADVTGEDIDQERLGGASVHASKSGVAHFAVDSEVEGLEIIKALLSYIPQNNLEEAPYVETNDPIDRLEDSLNEIIPDDPNKPYDVYEVIGAIVDEGKFLEVHKDYAKNIVVGFARFNGQSVGIVANQPKALAGVLDNNSSRKAARFVRFCDAFNIPLVTLVDVPGFLPGTQQEYGGIILHGAKLLYAYGEATVPKVTVVLRKAYGGAYCVMSSKHLRGDINYAWPTGEIAVMGPSGAIEVLYGKEMKEAADPKAFAKEKEQEYRDAFANPYNAAKYGYIDDVIEPRNTRFRIIRALQELQTKKLANPAKKHDNLPL